MLKILYIADLTEPAHRLWLNEMNYQNSSYLDSGATIANEIILQKIGKIEPYSLTQPWKNKKTKQFLSKTVFQKFDLVHFLGAEKHIHWLKYINTLNVKTALTTFGEDVVIHLQSLASRRDILGSLGLRNIRNGLKKAAFITTSSESEKEIIQRYFLGDFGVKVCPPIFNEQKINRKSEKKQILFGRNMTPNSNHHFALDCIWKIDSQIKKDYSFIFIDKKGWNKPYIEFIQEKINSLSDMKIEFLPFSSDSNEYKQLLSSSQVNVFTAIADGNSFEAYLTNNAGIPLICSDIGYDEQIDAALYYENYNEDEFLKSIVSIALDKQKVNFTENSYRSSGKSNMLKYYDEISG